jgi:hypothetical protein
MTTQDNLQAEIASLKAKHSKQVIRLADEKYRILRAASAYIAAIDWAASEGGAWGIDRFEAKRNVDATLSELRREADLLTNS